MTTTTTTTTTAAAAGAAAPGTIAAAAATTITDSITTASVTKESNYCDSVHHATSSPDLFKPCKEAVLLGLVGSTYSAWGSWLTADAEVLLADPRPWGDGGR